jgi:hypothetical protein
VEVPGGGTVRREFAPRLDPKTPAGRHVFVVRGTAGETPDGSDAFLVVDIE